MTAAPGNAEVTLTWTDPSDTSIIRYEYSVDSGTWTTIMGSDDTTTSATVAGLTNGTQYLFQVRAVNDTGDGAAATVSATLQPAKPTGLTAAAGDAEVTLSWTNPSNSSITSYEYSSNDGTNWTAISPSGATTVTYTVTSLTNGTSYTFRVRAVNDTGTGDASDSVAATPVLPAPSAPTALTATPGDKQVTLRWTNPSNSSITSYEYSVDSGDWTAVPSSDATTVTHTVTGLANGTEYTFRVRAVNSAGDGAASDSVKATPVGSGKRPDSPGLQTTRPFDNKVELRWQNPGDGSITSYQYSQDGGPWTTIPGSGSFSTSYNVTGLTKGETYSFRLRAVNAVGAGASSQSRTATMAPAAPTGLTTTPGNNPATLSWDNPNYTSIKRYEYRQSTDGGTNWSPDWTLVANSGATTVKHTVLSLTNGTAYTFQVRAVNNTGNGDASGSVTVTPVPPPAKPTGLTASERAYEMTLSWADPSNNTITGYESRHKESSASGWGAWTDIAGSGAATVSHTVTGLTNGTAYDFQVRAMNVAGTSLASDSLTATPFLIDYDTNNNGLIEVDSLAQLNAIRWDLDGDGVASTGNETTLPRRLPQRRAE